MRIYSVAEGRGMKEVRGRRKGKGIGSYNVEDDRKKE